MEKNDLTIEEITWIFGQLVFAEDKKAIYITDSGRKIMDKLGKIVKKEM